MRAWTMMAGAGLLMLAACGREDGAAPAKDGTATNMTTGVPVANETVLFAGTWTGPEGLSFVVEETAGGYRVRNRDTLDTEETFDATREGGVLRFVRRGEALTARLGTGAETGFKWLANKRDCLIVKAGAEGYCRD